MSRPLVLCSFCLLVSFAPSLLTNTLAAASWSRLARSPVRIIDSKQQGKGSVPRTCALPQVCTPKGLRRNGLMWLACRLATRVCHLCLCGEHVRERTSGLELACGSHLTLSSSQSNSKVGGPGFVNLHVSRVVALTSADAMAREGIPSPVSTHMLRPSRHSDNPVSTPKPHDTGSGREHSGFCTFGASPRRQHQQCVLDTAEFLS
jgi:hypothetical protein